MSDQTEGANTVPPIKVQIVAERHRNQRKHATPTKGASVPPAPPVEGAHAANNGAPSNGPRISPELLSFEAGVYYLPGARNPYFFRDGRGELFPWSEKDFARQLRFLGLSPRVPLGETVSPIDHVIRRVQGERSVHAALSLAGYKEGERMVNGLRVLILKGPNLPEPKHGPCETILRLLRQAFGEAWNSQPDQDPELERQLKTFCFWLARCYVATRDELPTLFRQMSFLIGDPGCGKTFIQEVIITQVLGGRSFKFNDIATGEDRFTGSLFSYEHLYVSDAQGGGSDIRARLIQQKRLKEMITGENHTRRAMHTDGQSLSPVWTLSYSANLDKMNELPPWDSDWSDKAHLFRCYPFWRPDGGEFKAWKDRILSEIPAFVHYLLENFSAPDSLPSDLRESKGGGRFGQRAFHHPRLLFQLHEYSLEEQLRELIRLVFFPTGDATMGGRSNFRLTAEELRRELRTRSEGRRALEKDVEAVIKGGPIAIGKRLAILAERYPHEVRRDRLKDSRGWVILAPNQPRDAADGLSS